MNNETFDAELEIENLFENGATDAGSLQLGFGTYDFRNKKYNRKFRFRSDRKLARPKFLLGR